MEPEQRDELREQSAGDDVIMLLLHRYAPLWLAGLLGAGIMAGGDGKRFADPRALDNVYGGRVRLLRRKIAVRRSSAGSDRTCIYYPDHALCLRRVAGAGDDLCHDPVCVFRFRFVVAVVGGCVVLARKHEVGRAGSDSLDSVRGGCSRSVAGCGAGARTRTGDGSLGAWWRRGLIANSGGTAVFGFMPVVPMVIVSALLMIVVSMMTKKPAGSTLAKIFGGRKP